MVLNITANIQKLSAKVQQYNFNTIFFLFFYLFIFSAPHITIKNLYDFANLPKSAFVQTGTLFFLSIWLINGLRFKKIEIRKSPFYMPLLLFFFWAFISIIYAHNKYEGFILWLHLVTCFFGFFLVLNILKDTNKAVLLLSAIFFSGCVTAIIGIGQSVFDITWFLQVVKPAATFGNKNMAAQISVIVFPIGLCFVFISKRLVCSWIYIFSICIVLAFLFFAKILIPSIYHSYVIF